MAKGSFDEVFEYITMFRVCAIMGRVGFGKTGLAWILADKMLKAGLVKGVITNFPSVFPSSVGEKDDGTLLNRVVIFDEGWQELDARSWNTNDTDSYGGFARKFGMYWLFPSVFPVDKRLRAIEIRPLHRNPFTNSATWGWKVATGERVEPSGRFTVNNKEFWNMYATAYIPPRGKAGDCGIKARYAATYNLFRDEVHEGVDTSTRATDIEA